MDPNRFPFQQLPPDIQRLLYTSSPTVFNRLSGLSRSSYVFGQTSLTVRQLCDLPISLTEIQATVAATFYLRDKGEIILYRPLTHVPSTLEELKYESLRITLGWHGGYVVGLTSISTTHPRMEGGVHVDYFHDKFKFETRQEAITYAYNNGFTEVLPGLEYRILRRRTPCVRADSNYAIKRVRDHFLRRIAILRGIVVRYPNVNDIQVPFIYYGDDVFNDILSLTDPEVQQARGNLNQSDTSGRFVIMQNMVELILRKMNQVEETGRPLL